MQLFEVLKVSDDVINRIQDRLKAVINAIARKPIIDGVLLQGVVVQTSSVTSVPHGLGRVPQGWIMLNGVPDTVTEMAAADDKFLYLQMTNSATALKLWVF